MSDVLTIVEVVSGISVALGAGGGIAVVRDYRNSMRRQAIRDEKLDRTMDVVLGTDDRDGLQQAVPKLQLKVDQIKNEMSPNGGKSLGDAVARIELALNKEVKNIWVALDGKVDKK